jgi:predicted metal-dependent phosphoesterase TrpH
MEVLAVCHVHSDWSYDGSWTLEELSAKFRGQGCQVLMMTEHDRGFTVARLEEYRVACAKVSSAAILVVPGIEYSDAENRVHVLVWGPVPFLGEALPTDEMLESVRSASGVAVLAHPSRKKAWENFSPYWAERLLGIEVWNRKYDGWAPSETSPVLLEQSSALPFVGLDFHTHRQSFPLSMALDLEGNITEERVVDCLRSRRCSPRAFGAPLDQNLFRATLPALRIAERSRRTAASIVRRSGIR